MYMATSRMRSPCFYCRHIEHPFSASKRRNFYEFVSSRKTRNRKFHYTNIPGFRVYNSSIDYTCDDEISNVDNRCSGIDTTDLKGATDRSLEESSYSDTPARLYWPPNLPTPILTDEAKYETSSNEKVRPNLPTFAAKTFHQTEVDPDSEDETPNLPTFRFKTSYHTDILGNTRINLNPTICACAFTWYHSGKRNIWRINHQPSGGSTLVAYRKQTQRIVFELQLLDPRMLNPEFSFPIHQWKKVAFCSEHRKKIGIWSTTLNQKQWPNQQPTAISYSINSSLRTHKSPHSRIPRTLWHWFPLMLSTFAIPQNKLKFLPNDLKTNTHLLPNGAQHIPTNGGTATRMLWVANCFGTLIILCSIWWCWPTAIHSREENMEQVKIAYGNSPMQKHGTWMRGTNT